MKTRRYGVLLAVAALAVLLPLQGASAWSSSGGYYGGGYYGGPGYHGYYGGYRGYYGGYRGYYGGYPGGCWNCGTAGAAFVGLAVGALVGSAIANASQPPVVVGPPGPPPPGGCDSVIVGGVPYYNCGGYNPRPYWGGYGAVEGWQSK
ncbi:MAG: hypothetical protein RKP20_09195 [Candidatus Competibacter sp.]|nr:hypothetical protein [Candidatus Competibacter sp.]